MTPKLESHFSPSSRIISILIRIHFYFPQKKKTEIGLWPLQCVWLPAAVADCMVVPPSI